MTEYDWKTATFSLTVDDVARVLKTTPQSVIDLMITGQLGYYMKAEPGRDDGLPIDAARFDPQDVTTFFEREHEAYVSITLPVLTNLRQYLHARPVTMGYDDALSNGLPLRTRSGLHVRIMTVVEYARRVEAPPAAQLTGSTQAAFERLGLTRVRGLTPFGEGAQRWGFWYRLPKVIAFQGQTIAMADFIKPGGTIMPREHEIDAPDGSGRVLAQPVHGEP